MADRKKSPEQKGASELHDELPEEDVFSQAMADVQPLDKGRQRKPDKVKESTPGQQQRRLDAEREREEVADDHLLTLGEVPPVEPLAFIEWKQDGVQNAVFEKLRKDGYGVDANLDLHRKTVKEARLLVLRFIRQASARGFRCLLISPGKGELSKTPGRLKSYLQAWLIAHPEVIAFSSAQRYHGGVGSVYALIRKSAASRELNREVHGQKGDFE